MNTTRHVRTPDALKRFAEGHKSCQMKAIFHSGPVWPGNNKLGSLRQRNCVWRVANRADQRHLCLWYFSRGLRTYVSLRGTLKIMVISRIARAFPFLSSKILIVRERKGDLKRPKILGIIPSCDWLYSKDRCLLLSSANDGEGRCVLLG